MLLTTRQGPNTGRQFYKCPKYQNAGPCDFFLWADASNTNTSVPPPAPYSRGAGDANNRQSTFQNQQNDDNSETCCGCGEQAKLLTVVKDGPTRGRPFYVCAKQRGAQCGFFQWADENGASGDGFGQDSNNRFGGGARYDGGSGSRGRGRGRGRGKANESSNNESKKARKCGNCGQEGINSRILLPKILYSIFINLDTGHTRNRCPDLD